MTFKEFKKAYGPTIGSYKEIYEHEGPYVWASNIETHEMKPYPFKKWPEVTIEEEKTRVNMYKSMWKFVNEDKRLKDLEEDFN